MTDDDLGGYLMDALRAAIPNGLTGLTLWRVGTSTTQWQASSQWRGRGGFCVRIEPDPVVALEAALRANDGPVPEAAPTASVFD